MLQLTQVVGRCVLCSQSSVFRSLLVIVIINILKISLTLLFVWLFSSKTQICGYGILHNLCTYPPSNCRSTPWRTVVNSLIGVQDAQKISRPTQKMKKEQTFHFQLTQMSILSLFASVTSVIFDMRHHFLFSLLFGHETVTFGSSPPAFNHPTACPSVTAHTASQTDTPITQTISKAPT